MPRSRRAGWILGIAAIACAFEPTAARATPPDLFGFGGRSPALAMTGVATCADYECVRTNPAGLSRVRARGVWLGVQAASYVLEVDGQPFPMEAARALVAGLVVPLPLKGRLARRIGFGLGFLTPSAVLLAGEVPYPEEVQFPVLARAQVVAVQLGLGVDLGFVVPGLRVGLGAASLANLTGDVRVRLDETSTFVSQTETQLLTSPSLVAGASYEAGRWSFGVTYFGEQRSELELNVLAQDLPVEVPELTIGGLVQYVPASLALEAAFAVSERWRVAAQVLGRQWSAWPGPQQTTSRSSRLAPDPGFHDRGSPRIAVEGRFGGSPAELTLRGGYAYEPTPSPPAQSARRRTAAGAPIRNPEEPHWTELRYVDDNRHVLTIGLGLRITIDADATLTFDGYAQAHLLAPRTHWIGVNDESPPMRSGGSVWVAGWVGGLEWR